MENYCLLYDITQFTETASARYKMNITLIIREGSQNNGTGLRQNMLHLLRLARAEVMVYKGKPYKGNEEVDWPRVQAAIPPSPGRPVLTGTLALPSSMWKGEGMTSMYLPRPRLLLSAEQVPPGWHAACSHMLSLPVQRTSGLPGCVRIHKCLSLHLDQGLSVPTDPEQMGNLGPEDGSAQPRA